MARLPQGVRKRADGTLEKRFTVDGKRYSIYGVNNKELQQKEKEIRKLIEAGIYTDNRNITLSLTQAHEYAVTSPKSEASKRDIPMNEIIKKILINQKKKMLMVFGGNSVRLENRIFVTSTGKVINAANFLNVMKRILREPDKKGIHIERFSHHAFRDTFATRYIEHGGNMQTLKTILGHSTLAMTADLYAHVLPDTKQKEMNLIEKGFEGVV